MMAIGVRSSWEASETNRCWRIVPDSILSNRRLPAVIVVVSSIAWSYTGYLTVDGAPTFAIRTADWLRDHRLSPLVDQIESRIYGKNPPSNDPSPSTSCQPIITAELAFHARILSPIQSMAVTNPYGNDSVGDEPMLAMAHTPMFIGRTRLPPLRPFSLAGDGGPLSGPIQVRSGTVTP